MSFSFTRTRQDVRSCAQAEDVAGALADPGGTVLAVWAHAGDAVLLAGGLLAAAAAAGVRVVQACATAVAPHAGSEEPRRREPVTDRVALFGELDVPCADVPRAKGVSAVQRLLDEHRPDSVISFGPDGVTGDPDHRAVARWVARAVAVSDPDHHLAHLVTDVAARWPEELVSRMHIAGSFRPGFPVRRTTGTGIDVHLDGDVLRRKVDALSGETHFGPLHDVLGDHGVRRLAGVESLAAVNEAARYRLGSVAGRTLVAA